MLALAPDQARSPRQQLDGTPRTPTPGMPRRSAPPTECVMDQSLAIYKGTCTAGEILLAQLAIHSGILLCLLRWQAQSRNLEFRVEILLETLLREHAHVHAACARTRSLEDMLPGSMQANMPQEKAVLACTAEQE